jgi:predicted N-acetyltransferase YhbS
MNEYQLISDYKHDEHYKASFNTLAQSIFEINFKDWYEKGFWNDRYICYSYVDEGHVIANASITKMTVVLNEKEYTAIQIGTVMTHPDYRNQGLSRQLIHYIIAKYEQECDFIYLFANDSVLDFYPRFGFERIQESSFSLQVSDLNKQHLKPYSLRTLSIDNVTDYQIMQRVAIDRIPVSSILSVKDNESLLFFYFIIAFNDALYYIEEQDTIVIFQKEEHQLHIFDIISTEKVNIETILNSIISAETEIIHFYFTPDYEINGIQAELITENDDTLFVRPSLQDLPIHFMFPSTSHA